MSKQRIINTRFWQDTYISELDPIEKLLFLYFLTNPLTDICGVYEIGLRQVALDTGIDREDMLPRLLSRFQKDDKIYYIDGWIYIKNFTKHQNLNPKVEIGIKRCFEAVPSHIRESIDSLSQPIAPNLTKLNLTKPNLTEPNVKPERADKEVFEIINLFKEIDPLNFTDFFRNTTERAAIEKLLTLKDVEWEKVIPQLKEVYKMPYFPSSAESYKPTELVRNWQKIRNFVEKYQATEQSKVKSKGKGIISANT